MQKRILIVSDGYTKPMYGPRMVQLCKYLHRRGWDITILTEQIENEPYQVADVRFLAMPYYCGKGPIRKAFRWTADKLFHWKDKMLYRFAKQEITNFTDFSIVLCSTFTLFPLQTAYRIAQENRLPLYVDLRDITEQWGFSDPSAKRLPLPKAINEWLIKRLGENIIKQRNHILKHAKAVITISPWHRQLLQQYNPNTHLIYNGFDPETFYPSFEKTDSFVISYVGRIYNLSFRNPRTMLQAVAELCQQSLIDKAVVKIVFHIESVFCDAVKAMVQEFGIQDICRVGEFVPPQVVQQILHNSAINVVLVQSETIDGSHGIMTTKFFEALGCEKPILCTPANTGCLADTIRYTNAGIATDSKEEIKQFILEKYHEWQAHGYTHQEVRNKEQFSREYQARQFEELFLQC